MPVPVLGKRLGQLVCIEHERLYEVHVKYDTRVRDEEKASKTFQLSIYYLLHKNTIFYQTQHFIVARLDRATFCKGFYKLTM